MIEEEPEGGCGFASYGARVGSGPTIGGCLASIRVGRRPQGADTMDAGRTNPKVLRMATAGLGGYVSCGRTQKLPRVLQLLA